MTTFLVELKTFDDTYYKTVVEVKGLITNPAQIVPEEVTELAHAKGFRVDISRLDTMDSMRTFLEQLEVAT